MATEPAEDAPVPDGLTRIDITAHIEAADPDGAIRALVERLRRELWQLPGVGWRIPPWTVTVTKEEGN